MTVDAVVSRATAAVQIPVPLHAAVRTMAPIALLRAVALTAKLHCFGHGHDVATGQAQRVVLLGMVARTTCQLSVRETQAGMRPLQRGRSLGQLVWLVTHLVTCGATDARHRVIGRPSSRRDFGERLGLVDLRARFEG